MIPEKEKEFVCPDNQYMAFYFEVEKEIVCESCHKDARSVTTITFLDFLHVPNVNLGMNQKTICANLSVRIIIMELKALKEIKNVFCVQGYVTYAKMVY